MRRQQLSARRLVGLAVIAALASTSLVALAARPVEAQESDPAIELAERYAPVVMLKEQDQQCDPDGEPYGPTSVDIVLDNPDVLLRQLGTGNPVVQRAPTSSDLYELGAGFFLDFPGSALDPGCLYERDFDRYSADEAPTVYAHVVQQEGHPDQLAVQYWFYWYYNDWNNKHESDWEGIQLLFDASSVEEALTVEPTSVGYAQHEGGEWADWDSSKLERFDLHPVVYSSAGSHASYFGSAAYLGRSGGEGFGCDNTDGPSVRLDPEVVLLPDRVDDPDSDLAWLAYEGRWGERQSGPFNGPTGPAAKERWLNPVDWHDELRVSSVVIPGGDGAAASVIDLFCTAVDTGSGLLIAFTESPLQMFLAALLLALFARWLINRTDWTPVPLTPLRQPRRAGQIFRSAIAISRRSWRALLGFGVIYLPVAGLVALLGGLITVLPLIGNLLGLAGSSSGTSLVLAVLVGSIPHTIAFVAVNALVSSAFGTSGSDLGVRRRVAIAEVRAQWRPLLSGVLRAVLIVTVLIISVVGIPWAIQRLIRYQFLGQVTMLEGVEGAAALKRSEAIVSGRWWHTAVVIAVINVVISGSAVLTGLIVLLALPGLPLWMFSAVASLVYILVVPPAAVAQTLLYGNAVSSMPAAHQGSRQRSETGSRI